MIDPLAGLNPAQREAVATVRGPLLVLAGAGTGKTRVITHRIAYLIKQGTPPTSILGVTFTNKAADEMRDRARQLLGGNRPDMPLLCTFHSLGVRILRQEIGALGYDNRFTIFDRTDQEGVARRAIRDVKADGLPLAPNDLLAIISQWKQVGRDPMTALQRSVTDRDVHAARSYDKYQSILQANNAVDFDDLLYLTEKVFREHPAALDRQRRRFSHLLVDEFQDTNASQFRIVRDLSQHHRNLCVVGDDDQAIYGWRGAEVKNILGFTQEYPDAVVVRLEENYRSCPRILSLANRLIANNADRHPKALRSTRLAAHDPQFARFDDESAEAAAVVRDIQANARIHRLPFSAFAILCRTNEQPRPFEAALRSAAVPHTVVGAYSFFDRKEIRDVLAYLRVLVQPRDETNLLRIINLPPRGLGTGAIKHLTDRAQATGSSLWEVLSNVMKDQSLPMAASAGLKSFVNLVNNYRTKFRQLPLSPTLHQLLSELAYRAEITRNYPERADQESRWEAVGELVNMLARYEARSEAPSLDGFLDAVTLDAREDNAEDKRKGVMVMTLHAAKGLEFPHVYLVGLEDGTLPHERSIESHDGLAEERRLLYVGITRARDRLTLTRCLTRTRWGRRQPAAASRFLKELFDDAPPPATGALALDAVVASSPRAADQRGFRKSRHARRDTD